MYQHKLSKLKTGLQVVIVPMPQVESMTTMIAVGAGSRYETPKTSGLFHFLEHMAFKGTEKRPSTLDIATELDSVGGIFNAFTDKELTAYWVKLSARYKGLAFDVLADMLVNSLLKPEEIEREKGVIVEEINMYKDMPERQVWEDFDRLIYGDNPMGWSTAGEKETVQGLNRRSFLRVFDQLYYPENMVLVIAGNVNPSQIKPIVSRFFNSLNKKGQKKTKKIKIDQSRSRMKLTTKKTEQAHFCLGVPGFKLSHPDRFALMVLNTVLGGGMSSRLWIEIRERRGLAYYVGSQPNCSTDSGYLLARSGVRIKSVDEAIRVVLEEFYKLTKELVPVKELQKAKESIKGRLVLALEDSQQLAARSAYQLLLEGQLRTTKQTADLIDKVTLEDVQRVAKKIFKTEKLNLALIGPFKSEERFKKLLKG